MERRRNEIRNGAGDNFNYAVIDERIANLPHQILKWHGRKGKLRLYSN